MSRVGSTFRIFHFVCRGGGGGGSVSEAKRGDDATPRAPRAVDIFAAGRRASEDAINYLTVRRLAAQLPYNGVRCRSDSGRISVRETRIARSRRKQSHAVIITIDDSCDHSRCIL